jgi:hypothetical protein
MSAVEHGGALVMRTALPDLWVVRDGNAARVLSEDEATALAATFSSRIVDDEATISTGGVPANLVQPEVR